MYLKHNNFRNILKLQNNIMKKEQNPETEIIDKKLKVSIELGKKTDKKEVIIQPTVENDDELFSEETLTQNQNNQKYDSASSSKNTNNHKSAINLKNTKNVSTKSEKVQLKHDQKSLTETPGTSYEVNQREQVQLADTIHQLSTLDINSQQINPGSTEETIEDVIQSQDNEVNQNQKNVMFLIKPLPKIVDKLSTFLSEDLLKKTCEVFI